MFARPMPLRYIPIARIELKSVSERVLFASVPGHELIDCRYRAALAKLYGVFGADYNCSADEPNAHHPPERCKNLSKAPNHNHSRHRPA